MITEPVMKILRIELERLELEREKSTNYIESLRLVIRMFRELPVGKSENPADWNNMYNKFHGIK